MTSPRRLPLRLAFAAIMAALALVSTAALAVLVSRETSERLRQEIGADLAELAAHMTNKLDRGMFERWRDLQVAASLGTMRDPTVGMEAKGVVIETLRSTYPDYAAIAFMTPDGRVATATIPQMVGANIANRDFFVEGSQRPFVGDVHDALLLAKILGNDPANPPRFVDLSAPVRAADGNLVGVIEPISIGPGPRIWSGSFEAPPGFDIRRSMFSSSLATAPSCWARKTFSSRCSPPQASAQRAPAPADRQWRPGLTGEST